VVLLVGLGLGGCSSSGSKAAPATTSTTESTHTRAFCEAWHQLGALNQDTAIADVAHNIVALQTIAHQLATEAPATIAPEARRYAAVIATVAQSLSSAGAVQPSRGTVGQLTTADRTKLAQFVISHCPNG